jgi:hypothetical protein
VAAAFSGVTYATGDPDRPPIRSGYALADYMSAAYNAFAVAMVLYHRDAQGDGRGQVIDLALYEPLLRASEASAVVFDRFGVVRERTGNRHAAAIPSGLYEASDGAWVTLFAAPDHLFERLARAIGRPELARDPRYANAGARRKHADELESEIGDWMAEHAASEILERPRIPTWRRERTWCRCRTERGARCAWSASSPSSRERPAGSATQALPWVPTTGTSIASCWAWGPRSSPSCASAGSSDSRPRPIPGRPRVS